MGENVHYTAKVLNSMKKVFPDGNPPIGVDGSSFTMLRNETFSFMVSYICDDSSGCYGKVRIESPIEQYCHIREIQMVPSVRSVNCERDEHYLCTRPGLYPDLLTELSEGQIQFLSGIYKSLWVDIEIPENGPWGDFPVKVVFNSLDGSELCQAETYITVFEAQLKPQTLIRTEWFHGDCLADYYKVPVFSEEHWHIMENFIAAAVKRGCNMILTPQFTPPLDTAPGGERTTIQLVDIKVRPDGSYEFGFEKLKRWVDLCRGCGMVYFEMSHLFTQWGAEHPPKIMAEKNGIETRIFGWNDPAVGGRYSDFLGAYLPELTGKLREWNITDKTRFHISDEPRSEHLESYKKARQSVAPYLKDFIIMDAISSLELCQKGGIECPVCANDHIKPFLEAGTVPLWSYYCTSQSRLVSNRFMSMPSSRCRIYGAQVFKYELEGILHWGYNFYNSQYSVRHLDPYRSTDADGAFPSGDPFLVYPGADKKPEESLRMMTMCHMMQDVRAMEQLAETKGRDYVVDLIEDGLDMPITFEQYPNSDLWLIQMRNRINSEIEDSWKR